MEVLGLTVGGRVQVGQVRHHVRWTCAVDLGSASRTRCRIGIDAHGIVA